MLGRRAKRIETAPPKEGERFLVFGGIRFPDSYQEITPNMDWVIVVRRSKEDEARFRKLHRPIDGAPLPGKLLFWLADDEQYHPVISDPTHWAALPRKPSDR